MVILASQRYKIKKILLQNATPIISLGNLHMTIILATVYKYSIFNSRWQMMVLTRSIDLLKSTVTEQRKALPPLAVIMKM